MLLVVQAPPPTSNLDAPHTSARPLHRADRATLCKALWHATQEGELPERPLSDFSVVDGGTRGAKATWRCLGCTGVRPLRRDSAEVLATISCHPRCRPRRWSRA